MSLRRTALGGLLTALLMLVFASPASADDARIHLIHGIPDTDVDVSAGGETVFEDFAFGDTQDLSALAGATLEDLQVSLAGTDTVAIDAGDVALPESGNLTVIAHLDADGNPTLSIFENDTSTVAAGESRLVVRHTAAAPEVDILAGGAVAFAAVPNGAEGSADLPAGTVTAEVVPAGESGPVVIGPADLALAEGSSLTVYAVGSLDGGTLTVLTESIDGLASTPSAVNTGTSTLDGGSATWTWVALATAGAAVAAAGAAAGVARRRPATVRAR